MSATSPADLASGALALWLAVAYVAFIALRGLPSNARPGRLGHDRVLASRVAFFMAFYLVPGIAYRFLGLRMPGIDLHGPGDPGAWVLPVAGIAVAAFGVGFLSRKSAADLANYPQYLPRPDFPRPAALANEIGSWALYLWAYEFAFRGMLLSMLLPAGTATAIAVQTGLYAFAHLPKNAKEAAAALLFGVAASLMTLGWGSVIPAFVVHLALALGNDLSCALKNRTGNAGVKI
ncbi:MAG: CPBP family intramembrane metalloprotease [Spirochaetales bacterium]|nr:CPBP family intramembrane metalloprotease [Spirochaetales bacterium]